MNFHPASFTVLAFISLSCLYQMSSGLTAKFTPDYNRAESNNKWSDKPLLVNVNNEETPEYYYGYNTRFQEIPVQAAALVDSDNIPLPLALKMLHDKRGFDFGTGRSFTGFQAMRGNLGLQASLAHGRRK